MRSNLEHMKGAFALLLAFLLAAAALGGCGKLNELLPGKDKEKTSDQTSSSKQAEKTSGTKTEDPSEDDPWGDPDWDDEDPDWDPEDPDGPMEAVKPYEAEVRPLDGGDPVKKGDIVTFGSYPQTESGGVMPIEWIVLDVKDGKALLLSRYVLDARDYHSDYQKFPPMTWEECELRTWLNEEFFHAAFSGVSNRIVPSLVTADKTMNVDSDPGNDVTDMVFLLSAQDVINPAYGFRENYSYGLQDPIRMAAPTPYARAQGVFFIDRGPDQGNTEWWLRSTGGSNGKCASYIYSDGFVCTQGQYYVSKDAGVRPSVWVSLK